MIADKANGLKHRVTVNYNFHVLFLFFKEAQQTVNMFFKE